MKGNKTYFWKKTAIAVCLCSMALTLGACVDYSGAAADGSSSVTAVENDAASGNSGDSTETGNAGTSGNGSDSTETESEAGEDTDTEIGALVNTEGESPVVIATSVATAQICAALEIPLAGVPHSDTYTVPEVYQGAVEVGTGMAPDMEIISSLNPDWVLSPVSLISDLQPKYEEVDTEYAFLNLSSVPGMYKSIEQLGQLFGKEEQAKQLVKEFEDFYGDYQKKHTGKEAPTVLILMGVPGSYVVATPKSYVGNLVEMAGGMNVYSDETEDFINVSTEDMLEKNPDIILRTAHALPESVMEMFAEEFETNDIWKHFSAVEENRVYDLDYNLFSMSANLQYQDALESLDTILYGDESIGETN